MKRRTVLGLVLWACGAWPVHGQVINEINVHPAGGVRRNSMYVVPPCSAEMSADEWIELYNPSPCRTIDLSCYILGSNMGAPSGVRLCSDGEGFAVEGDNEGYFVFPPGTVIPPLGFVVVGGNPASRFNTHDYRGTYYCGGPRWFLNSRTGWVGLFDPQGNVVDAAFWAEYGEDEIFSSEQLVRSGTANCACSGAISIPSARALYEQNRISFLGLTVPTPGFYTDADWGKLYREPDGGCWRILHPGTRGGCNTRCWDGKFLTLIPRSEFFCEQTTLQAEDTRACYAQSASFHWQTSDGTSRTGSRFSLAGITGDTVTVVLTATLPDGCTDVVSATYYRRTGKPKMAPQSVVLCPTDTFYFTVTGMEAQNAAWEWEAEGLRVWRQGERLGVASDWAGEYPLRMRFRYPDGCVSPDDTAWVVVQTAPTAAILNFFPEICAGQSVMLRAQTVDGARVEWDFDGGRASDSLGYGGINVHWDSPGEKTVRIFVSHPDYSCTFDRATTTIVVKPAPELPEVRIVPTEQAQCGFSVLGLAPPPPGVKYVSDYGGAKVRLEDEWPEEFRYVVYPGDVPPPYRMTFRAVNDVGCESETATLIVDFDANIAETILRYRPPNVFTPNGDDVNPVYFLPGLQSGCAEYEMNIYDRWGMCVARINNAQPTWDGAVDGRPSPETVFVYVLKLKLFDGRETQKNGTITLLR